MITPRHTRLIRLDRLQNAAIRRWECDRIGEWMAKRFAITGVLQVLTTTRREI